MSRVLLLAHDQSLRDSRALVLRAAGYEVVTANSTAEAVTKLKAELFELVIIDRNATGEIVGLDRALREAYPDQAILKVAIDTGEILYASRMVGAAPREMLDAVKEMLQVGRI